MYSKEFEELVIKGVNEKFYIGSGNPNAQILIVGKEAAIGETNDFEIQNRKNYFNNAQDWQGNIKNEIFEVQENWDYANYLKDEKATNNPLFAFKGAQIKEQGKTWRKYQKLHDFIFERAEPIGKYCHDFQKNFFLTEMSDNPLKTTSEAKRVEEFRIRLQQRKETFFKSKFIFQFPVVILACSDYICNLGIGKDRQIDDIFDVKYKGCYQTKTTKQSQSFYLHFNQSKSRLVIHTHQLSGSNASNELLQELGKCIREFMSNRIK